jgi:hypothetical protein
VGSGLGISPSVSEARLAFLPRGWDVSAFVFSMPVSSSVGGMWYWQLRCWDDEVNQQNTIAAGAVKAGCDPQLAVAAALEDCAQELARLARERWVLWS